jgi:hypothetical protein
VAGAVVDLGVARRAQIGTIGVNHYLPDVNSPFGGIKASDLGGELGPEAIVHHQRSEKDRVERPMASRRMIMQPQLSGHCQGGVL